MSMTRPDDSVLQRLFDDVKTIAVVGLSPQSSRPSHRVALAMQRYGYLIIPVRPLVREILGETAYASLADIPCRIDLVNVFRAAVHIPAIVDQCLALNLPAIWIQEGIVAPDSANKAQSHGMTVIMDRCLLKDYIRLKTS